MTRPTCTFCARKHLSQAYVLCEEAQQGYPEHIWFAIGHLAEASAELLERHPAMAGVIREQRKRLEDSFAKSPGAPASWVYPSFGKLIQAVSTLREGVGRKAEPPAEVENYQPHTAKTVAAPAPVKVAEKVAEPEKPGCPSCADKARQGRWAAEQGQMGSGKKYPRGRLLILTTLSDFSPSYSLVTVILNQAAAAAAAGYRVTLGVHVGCNLADLPPLPEAIDVVGIIPRFQWKADIIDETQVEFIRGALTKALDSLGACKILSHDLIFQSWFCTVAKAIHTLPPRENVSWYHICHSSVVGTDPVPEAAGAKYRRTLPFNHTLLILNYADILHFQNYYRYGTIVNFDTAPTVPVRNIKTLLNPRDIRVFSGMGETASTIITKHQPHLVDVSQVFPLCLTRIQHKRPEMIIELFAQFKKMGQSIRLIFATAHANHPDDRKKAIRYRELALSKGMTEDELVFTHESLPETATHGLDRDAIRSLFSVTNLFVFPSETEAGSLVLLEAAQSGNLLVLNESLPCLADYIPREMALWVPWGSLKETGTGVPLEELCATILDRLAGDMSHVSKRHALKLASLEAYSERLVEVLEG